MRLPSLPVTLKHGVGRRILGFFVLAGIVPVFFTAGLAYLEVSRGLDLEVNRTLRERAKDYGLDVLARLQQSSAATDQIARIVRAEGPENLTRHAFALLGIASVWLVDAEGRVDVIYGDADGMPEDPGRQVDDTVNLPRLWTDSEADGGYIVHQRRLLPPDGAGPGAVLRVLPKASRLWGSLEDLPFATDVCVFKKSGAILHCSSELVAADRVELAAMIDHGEDALAETGFEESEYVAAYWELFLAGEFGALRDASLDVVARQPKSLILRSRANFKRVFLPALFLVVILVGLLSFNMIGRSLIPLRRLTRAAGKLAEGNLRSRVRIDTQDEFASLGDAFNHMARRLGRQFDTLRAMSDIDRRILSGLSFEEVSESVLEHLRNLTDSPVVAVVARDRDAPHWAKMITSNRHDVVHERIALPVEMTESWHGPREVVLDELDPVDSPYRIRLAGFGVDHATLVPVVQDDVLNGILLLGAEGASAMTPEDEQQCLDLAGRFGVALASAEREEALYRQAHFDELTGLPNRQLLKDRLEQQIGHARREKFHGAVLFLDLDRFKKINDAHGHSTGDIVLMQAAERILAEVRESDTVARLGGDEFVVVMNHVDSDSRVRATASRLLERLTESFSIRGQEHYVGASIGIAMFPDDGDSVETLLKNADAAMYRAKDAGRARFEFCSRKLNAESRRKLDLERDLRTACSNRELELHYQPQIDLNTGLICGAEALLRWKHPTAGPISPAEFIPLAEESNLIVEIGRWVIDQACVDLRQMLDEGLHPGSLSINVSARQLRESSLIGDVFDPLQRHGIHPGYLQLEVTETTVAENRDTAIDMLNELREEGVRIAIDDFGTGYSSLSYLQQLPFDAIKIDKTFVDKIGVDDASDNICRTIITMAHELRKKSVAEGAETADQVAFLKRFGCDDVQGYFFSKPLPKEQFFEYLRQQEQHTQRRKALEVV